jgi:cytosine/adenosine deaminase-related metal-dependent hydrolase
VVVPLLHAKQLAVPGCASIGVPNGQVHLDATSDRRHRCSLAATTSTPPTWSPEAITDDTVTGLAPGASADLVVVAADTVTAAVMDHPPRTLVIRGGDVIARDGQLC